MNLRNNLDITVPETLIQRLQQTKEAVKENFNDFTDDWKQTAIQGTQNAMDRFNNTIENTKASLEQNLPQVGIQNVLTSSVSDWYDQHPAFSKVITLFNWSISHPIISFILIVFSLAIFWSLIKAIGRLIESASLSILQIPLKLFQALIKYIWRSLSKFSNFTTQKNTDTKILEKTSKHQIQNITAYQIVPCSKQQRLKDISARLEDIQREQQELLQEAADILDSERINSSVN
ncbi:hypothetical protein [Rivularia sp. UHCC 0363]|uniref:hypothetical protein n=1 Tax=Rivularia sp. UHCC 0363 TaxID=3110244 RepID=UPI002B21AAB3|nr:hypothetical protein [Rivularia sp. UHCC 0363]MEA5593622.1 hypothetical protein [Rivularia sp. UHCC 0363]